MGKIKETIDKILSESIAEINSEQKQDYYNQINQKYDDLLVKAVNNPNFVFILNNEMENKDYIGDYNKCETNVFNFIKTKLKEGCNQYFPVGGFVHIEKHNLKPIEHYWVYDKKSNKHIEITPITGFEPTCYSGIINFDINSEILKARNYYDVDFFKGGSVYFKYFK